jgi:hypothetical protein
MFNPKIDVGNIIAVSEEDLKEEQKQTMEKAIEEYRQLEQEWTSHPEARFAVASASYL